MYTIGFQVGGITDGFSSVAIDRKDFFRNLGNRGEGCGWFVAFMASGMPWECGGSSVFTAVSGCVVADGLKNGRSVGN